MNQRTQKPIDWSQVPEFRSNDPKLYELDPVLLDDDPDALMPDYISRLGTSAIEASKAFQDLQEASKDLVDLEIVVPSAYRTEADQRAIDALPKGPSFHAQRPVLRGGLILHENQRPPKEPDIDQALRDLFREPWYKRLWSWLRGAK